MSPAKRSFPLIEDHLTDLPGDDGVCPCCGSAIVNGQPEAVTLVGGAAYGSDSRGFGPSEDMRGFLSLYWSKSLGREDQGVLTASLPIARRVIGGQYSIRLCSLRCLRAFLGSIVDAFAEEIQEQLRLEL